MGFDLSSYMSHDAGKGSFGLGVGYKLARGAMDGKLEAIGRVQTGYDLGQHAWKAHKARDAMLVTVCSKLRIRIV